MAITPWILKETSGAFATSGQFDGLEGRLDEYDKVSGTYLTNTSAAQTYLAKTVAESTYAKKTDIPSVDGLLSKTEAASTYQPIGNYATTDAISDMETKTHAAGAYLTKNSADTLYATKNHTHDSYVERSEIATPSGQWNEAYTFASTHGKTLTINGTTFDGTKDVPITISPEGGGLLPPTSNGNWIFKIDNAADPKVSGWDIMPDNGKVVSGAPGEIVVDTNTDNYGVRLHQDVKDKLAELDDPMTIVGGDGIKVDAKTANTLEISYSGKKFPDTGIHNGLNVLSANGTNYEWVNGEQYYAYRKTYKDVSTLDTSGVAKNVEFISHTNSTGTAYNLITMLGKDSKGKDSQTSLYTLPNHWTKMFTSAANTPAGSFIKATPGNGSDYTWYDIEPQITSPVANAKYGWTTGGWKTIKEGSDPLVFDSATVSGNGTDTSKYGVKTDIFDGKYLPLTGGTVTGPTTFDDKVLVNYQMTDWNGAMQFSRGDNACLIGKNALGGFTIKNHTGWQLDYATDGTLKTHNSSEEYTIPLVSGGNLYDNEKKELPVVVSPANSKSNLIPHQMFVVTNSADMVDICMAGEVKTGAVFFVLKQAT